MLKLNEQNFPRALLNNSKCKQSNIKANLLFIKFLNSIKMQFFLLGNILKYSTCIIFEATF